MNFLTAIFDSLVGFIRRNPVTCLVIVILAVAAPAVLKGIALFVLYFILGLIVLALVLTLLFRWRIYQLRRGMEEPYGSQGGFGSASGPRSRQQREGDVKIYKTQDAPAKRVSSQVGDYVEFEETKDKN